MYRAIYPGGVPGARDRVGQNRHIAGGGTRIKRNVSYQKAMSYEGMQTMQVRRQLEI